MMDEESEGILSQPVKIAIGVVVVIAAILGGYYWYRQHPDIATTSKPAEAPQASAPVAAPPAAAPSPYQHPIDDSASDHSTPLDRSDEALLNELSHVTGWNKGVLRLILPENLIRHFVATVDALPREKLPLAALPTKPVAGQFKVSVSGGNTVIAGANDRRYAPFVEAFTSLDTAQLVSVYKHFYPLFQQAYKDLGYPQGYFNDRLVEVIDDLFEAPDPKPPIAVVAPRVMYHYVDADLEGLSAGQKILVRVGPSNEKAIKDKLREIRQAITTP
jgi:hypothetical protein